MHELHVSIHAPRRGATAHSGCTGKHIQCFNPRAPAGRDISPTMFFIMLRLFQSTRPGGARLAVFSRGCRTINVSIHAPRRGATFYPSMSSPTFCVSIHAPRRGATFGDFPKSRNNTSFNPRAPAGRDFLIVPRQDTTYQFQSTRPGGARHSLLFHVKIPHIVSIHAPRRGATWHRESALREWLEFQSTRPGGARHMIGGDTHSDGQFQSTRPGGARHQQAVRQPRHGRVSIHAPRRGATSASHIYIFSIIGFNPRAPAGRDTHYLCQWE